jgi:L-alanine-DL-glutamate epimerase-like enolase superfamily enzyme
MKVEEIEVAILPSRAPEKPVRDALQVLSGGGSVRVTVKTDGEAEGEAVVGFGRIAGAADSLAAIIEKELKPMVLHRELFYPRSLHEEMIRETEYHGAFGLTMFGISAIDTALWDCIGKAYGVPCWKLWGGALKQIPAYAMVGWMNFSDDELRDICSRAVEQGFRAIKIKVGYPTLGEDLHRIAVAREACGPEVRLMVDANQSLSTPEALIRGRAYQDHGIYWWEEPIPADDIDGYAELSERLDIPIATGENLYTPQDFGRFLKRDAMDIVQADLRRAGGPTALLQIGLTAAAFRKPYASHGGGPVHLNVMACLPNALYLETGLIRSGSPLKLKDGVVQLPMGAGFSWK